MDVYDRLIDLRITMTTACDGFSTELSNKNIILSSRIKILYLLSEKDMAPTELITSLGMAKSNLANLSKQLIEEGVIESYKTLDNIRHVFYRITTKGKDELQAYKKALNNIFCEQYKDDIEELNIYLDKILKILKKD